MEKVDEDDLEKKPSATTTIADLSSTAFVASAMIGGVDGGGGVESFKDEDDDDWSRQVETDEIAPAMALLQEEAFRMESVLEESKGIVMVHANNLVAVASSSSQEEALAPPPPPPSHRELTLKERLVLRERQRRIETERARLKRQFALSNTNGGGDTDHYYAGGDGGSEVASYRDVGSWTEGTLGEESTRAHPDEETSDQEKPLGFNMERFLRNSVTFDPHLKPTHEDDPTVMERFLSDPVVVETQPTNDVEDVASVSVSETGGITSQEDRPLIAPESFVSFEETNVSTNASVEVEADDDDIARDPLTPMASVDAQDNAHDHNSMVNDLLEEPRVLRLTEADMQEMAAIEEASIGNAPPSDREEEMLSEIGELADFGGGPHNMDPSGNFSQGTPTTAVESASLISAGNHSAPPVSSTETDHAADKHNLDGFLSHHHVVDPTERVGVDVGALPLLSSSSEARTGSGHGIIDDHGYGEQPLLVEEAVARLPTAGINNAADDRDSPPLVNRVLRPGMMGLKPHLSLTDDRLMSGGPLEPVVVDGFDFDKHAPTSPVPSTRDDSYRDLPMDAWSPPGRMQVSPVSLKKGALPATMEEPPSIPFMHEETRGAPLPRGGSSSPSKHQPNNEATPLLRDVPPIPEVLTSSFRSDRHRESHRFSLVSIGSIFSDVRSEEEMSREEIQNESEIYFHSSMLARAFPERLFALTVTLIFEIPVLLMISGGSSALCELIGRKRYQLLMGFLPLTSAISGNVGLQSSTLTTRAISHCQVTPDSFIPWFLHEMGAACFLGTGMGCVQGTLAFFASGMDIPFGVTIFIAQFISIVTAGCTGTIAPLLFSFIFRRDSGKWGGPLETAIQDIVGSFAMVVISYHILKLFGPGPIDASDVCSATSL